MKVKIGPSFKKISAPHLNVHTKCQGHQPSGSAEDCMAAILLILSLLFCHFSVDVTYPDTLDWGVTGKRCTGDDTTSSFQLL